MFKLYKKLRPIDWVLLAVLMGLTFFQVYFTMSLADYLRDIVSAITYLDYHNNPANFISALGEMATPEVATQINALIEAYGWQFPESVMSAIPVDARTTIENIANATVGNIWLNGGKMLLVALGSTIAQICVGLIASYVSASLSTNIRSAVYRKADSFSVNEINKFSTPSLITRATNDVQQVQIANIMALRMVVAAPITAVWAILKIRLSSIELTWVTAVAVIALICVIMAIMLIVIPKFKIMQKLTDRLNGVTRESLTGIRVIRAYNAEGYQEEKFNVANENITRAQLFTGRIMALMSPAMSLIMNGVSLTIYWVGSSLINDGVVDYATIVSFMQLSTQIIMSFMMLMMMFILFPRAQVSAGRINEILETEPSVKDPEIECELIENGTVEFKNVSFGYPGSDECILKNISFRVEKGQTVAFIGATGSGKTTLINLVPRFFDVTEGQVIVDGVDVKSIKQKTLHHIISYVPQKAVLFSGTVKDNIAFGNTDLSFEKVVQASKIAEADEFVSAMENGYESPISQGGKNVSGGQKQRLSIARAVAMDSEIIIFDDSFSALDYKTDRKVRDNLKSLGDVTKLIVAQRIGTIMDADKIVVLENGEAIGIGTHKELLNSCPIYKEIALSQLTKEELGL